MDDAACEPMDDTMDLVVMATSDVVGGGTDPLMSQDLFRVSHQSVVICL